MPFASASFTGMPKHSWNLKTKQLFWFSKVLQQILMQFTNTFNNPFHEPPVFFYATQSDPQDSDITSRVNNTWYGSAGRECVPAKSKSLARWKPGNPQNKSHESWVSIRTLSIAGQWFYAASWQQESKTKPCDNKSTNRYSMLVTFRSRKDFKLRCFFEENKQASLKSLAWASWCRMPPGESSA